MEPVGLYPHAHSHDGGTNSISVSSMLQDHVSTGLVGRNSSGNGASLAHLRGIYCDNPDDEDAYIMKSDINIPKFLMNRGNSQGNYGSSGPRMWQTELQFDNEKVCKLAAEHIASRGKLLRAERQEACRRMLTEVVDE